MAAMLEAIHASGCSTIYIRSSRDALRISNSSFLLINHGRRVLPWQSSRLLLPCSACLRCRWTVVADVLQLYVPQSAEHRAVGHDSGRQQGGEDGRVHPPVVLPRLLCQCMRRLSPLPSYLSQRYHGNASANAIRVFVCDRLVYEGRYEQSTPTNFLR